MQASLIQVSFSDTVLVYLNIMHMLNNEQWN